MRETGAGVPRQALVCVRPGMAVGRGAAAEQRSVTALATGAGVGEMREIVGRCMWREITAGSRTDFF